MGEEAIARDERKDPVRVGLSSDASQVVVPPGRCPLLDLGSIDPVGRNRIDADQCHGVGLEALLGERLKRVERIGIK
jgi:hypothetical protein